MGQVRRVEVHRLLTEDSVDKGMVEILRGKSVLFDSYARGSTIKDATPDAVDTGDHAKPEKAMSQREQERQIISAERQRLGLPRGTLQLGRTRLAASQQRLWAARPLFSWRWSRTIL